MFNKISTWWYRDGRYMHKHFVKGVKNLWRWFPVIWKDRDWDQYYIYEVLAKKIQLQAEYIGSNDRHTAAKRDAERMQLVVKLIRLQQEDFYDSEYIDYHKTNWKFVPTDETKKWFTMEDELISERFDEYFAKYPRQYKRALNGELNRFKRDEIDTENKHLIAMEIANENQRRCKALLFKLMEENIDGWWD
jgi:hypothetical protein